MMSDGLHAGRDATGAEIDGAKDVVVGKDNRQQTGGYGDQRVTVNTHDDDSEHTTTIKLVYGLVMNLREEIARERAARQADMAALREELGALQHTVAATQLQIERVGDHVAAMSTHWQQAVILNQTHRRTFLAGFVLLSAPVPLYFDGFLRIIDLNWPIALLLALACYALSAGFWHYMWWPR